MKSAKAILFPSISLDWNKGAGWPASNAIVSPPKAIFIKYPVEGVAHTPSATPP